MKNLNGVELLALVLVIVGGINWGLIGLANFDLVEAIFGASAMLTRLVYVLVGLSAVYVAVISMKLAKK